MNTPRPAHDLRYVDERRSACVLKKSPVIKGYILKLKKQRDEFALRELGWLLLGLFEDVQWQWKPTMLVPVPLHPDKLAKRGYNQAELLANYVARNAIPPIRMCSALQRLTNTRTQRGLDASARRQNLAGIFHADPATVTGQYIILIDDMLTTGATVDECARALKLAGAKKVWALTVASGYITDEQAKRPGWFARILYHLKH